LKPASSREDAGQPEKLRAPDRLRGLVEETRCTSSMDISMSVTRETNSSGILWESYSRDQSQVLIQEPDDPSKPSPTPVAGYKAATSWSEMQAITRERDDAVARLAERDRRHAEALEQLEQELQRRCGAAESRCDDLWQALLQERSAAKLQLETLARERDEAISQLSTR